MTAACPKCGAVLAATQSPITVVGVVLATPAHQQDGLLGWARVEVGPFLLAGFAVRRRRDGEITVTYPARRDQQGDLHRLVTTLDSALDLRIRAAVIAAYIAERTRAGRRPS